MEEQEFLMSKMKKKRQGFVVMGLVVGLGICLFVWLIVDDSAFLCYTIFPNPCSIREDYEHLSDWRVVWNVYIVFQRKRKGLREGCQLIQPQTLPIDFIHY